MKLMLVSQRALPLICSKFDKIATKVRRLEQKSAVSLIFVLIVISMYVPIVYLVARYGFWRHDALTYVNSYRNKLLTEGRWLNYFFFDLLHLVPPLACWLFAFVSLGFCAWQICRQNLASGPEKALVIGTFVASPGIFAQLNWPAMGAMGAGLLATSTFFVTRIPYPLFLPLFSVLAFGATPWVIYILPLFYLGRRFEDWQSAMWWWFKFVVCWASSFILGYLVANLMTWLILGQRITITAWRRPRPASDFSELISNLEANISVFLVHVTQLFPAGCIIILFFSVIVVVAALYRRPKQMWIGLVVFAAVGCVIAICHYIVTAPVGFYIQHRTVVPTFWGLVVAFWGLRSIANRTFVAILVFLFMGIPAWYASYKNVLWFSATTREIVETLQRCTSRPLRKYQGVIVDARNFSQYYKSETATLPKPYGNFFEALHHRTRWARALTELGVRRITLCPRRDNEKISGYCKTVLDNISANACREVKDLVCEAGVTNRNELILRLMK